MTRDDYLEVAVRVLGLYAWLQAAFAAVDAIAWLPNVAYMAIRGPEPHTEVAPLGAMVGALAVSSIKCVILFLLGRYLVSDGRWVIRQVGRLAGGQHADSGA